MVAVIFLPFLSMFRDTFRGRALLQLELLALRHQLATINRTSAEHDYGEPLCCAGGAIRASDRRHAIAIISIADNRRHRVGFSCA
jgi:hypothetical protein